MTEYDGMVHAKSFSQFVRQKLNNGKIYLQWNLNHEWEALSEMDPCLHDIASWMLHKSGLSMVYV